MIILCEWEGPSFSMGKFKCGSKVICVWEGHFFSAASGWIPSTDCRHSEVWELFWFLPGPGDEVSV